MNNSIIYGGVMLMAGIGIPIMAALNGNLGHRLQSPIIAASALFFLGLVITLSVLMLSEQAPSWSALISVPWYFYGGGIFVVFYILSITWVAPRFGISNAVSFVLLGQLIAMTAIDHFGILGAQQLRISTERIVGLILMAFGILMVVQVPKN